MITSKNWIALSLKRSADIVLLYWIALPLKGSAGIVLLCTLCNRKLIHVGYALSENCCVPIALAVCSMSISCYLFTIYLKNRVAKISCLKLIIPFLLITWNFVIVLMMLLVISK